MLTPQEVSEKKFKQATFGGYAMSGVDEFLEMVTSDYTTLFKENAVLKNKMKVLVEKIEEYRSNDDSIKQAYMAIKRQAETELEQTRAEVALLKAQAVGELETIKEKLSAEIELEEKRLDFAREQTVVFINALRELYATQMEKLSFVSQLEFPETAKQKRDAAITDAAREIAESMAPVVNAEESQQEVPESEPEDDTKTYEIRKSEQAQPAAITEEEFLKKQQQTWESFEVKFPPGVLDENDAFEWETEHDTEVPQPRKEPPADMDKLFGNAAPKVGKMAKASK